MIDKKTLVGSSKTLLALKKFVLPFDLTTWKVNMLLIDRLVPE